jgi:hypothetical protein
MDNDFCMFRDPTFVITIVLALFGLAATILWPDQKWIGYACLVLIAVVLFLWVREDLGATFVQYNRDFPRASRIVVFLFGGLLSVLAWSQVMARVSAPGRLDRNESPQPSSTPPPVAASVPATTAAKTVTKFVQPAIENHEGWRMLEDWQKVRLAAVLVLYPQSKLRIVSSSFGKEAWNYALQFKEVFEKSNWRVTGPYTAPVDQAALDIQLSASEQYFGKGLPPNFQAVYQMLPTLQIRTRSRYVADPLVEADELVMWVGAKGPSDQGPDMRVPLQLIESTCERPIAFTDDPVPGGSIAAFARLVKIKPPRGNFRANEEFIVPLTGSSSVVESFQAVKVEAFGKLMPRPDILRLTVLTDLTKGEAIILNIYSPKELKVRCVDDRFAPETKHERK